MNPFREVNLQVPAEIFNGDPRGLIKHLGLKGRPLGDNRWAVRPTDDTDLVKSYDLADETGLDHRFDRLSLVPPTAESFADDHAVAERFDELHSQLLERLQANDLSAVFHQIQANIVRAHSIREDLIAPVKAGYDRIGQMPMGDSWQPAFPNRSAHLVVATKLLIGRVRLPGVVFRFDQDPDALEILTGQGDAVLGRMFASSADWFVDVISLVHYLGPLLGCLSPRFWCLPAGLPPTAILFNLGLDINGQRLSPMEPMQLIHTRSRDEPIPKVQLGQYVGNRAIHWWAFRLNQMFGYLADPTTFRDADGNYAAHEHHHWMLTFGQVFGLMTSLQLAIRDRTAQRALMNSLLDAFADRIMDREFEQLCTWKYAQKTANQVRQKMDPGAAAILMPAADRAVDALKRAQQGFFIQQQRSEDKVRLRLPDGTWETKSPERATAMLLKVYRNATHGFGHRRGARHKHEIDASLLVHHHGELPADIVYLPYLYLLDTLCNPERVRANIERKVGTPD
ncbi:hypothetical protein A5738_22550 [Mycobacterium colombiense]|nr:hypothetical protein A5738_22550 [Mycobacterium colombiense]